MTHACKGEVQTIDPDSDPQTHKEKLPLHHAREMMSLNAMGGDTREGFSSFLQKRPPISILTI